MGIVHRNLKSSCIYLDRLNHTTLNAYVGDFDSALSENTPEYPGGRMFDIGTLRWQVASHIFK